VIRGWANYFRTALAKEIFSGLDRWMFYKADRHTRGMHPKKSPDWRHRKYWGRFHLDRIDPWVFGDKQTGAYLLKLSWFPIERHTLVKGTSSPDDPRLKDYWLGSFTLPSAHSRRDPTNDARLPEVQRPRTSDRGKHGHSTVKARGEEGAVLFVMCSSCVR
jgi:hypothetical protein